ncbi:phosphatidylinositide phosphatase SAC2-like isoform X2 [Gordionus sp. m RMFG-2023]|uniref:phosphatidylinositide phosphatase SAC2-like isoform X2 n=1 Tax=Gordionus sp. m RMFG-2023 TaxID=3053472 RepID=UPI0031FD691D
MEIFNTDNFYIFWNGISSLWCNKKNGHFEIKNNINPPDDSDLECLGLTYGLLGKLQPFTNIKYGGLIVITEKTNLDCIYENKSIIRIDKISILPFCEELLNDNNGIDQSNSVSISYEPKLFYDLATCNKHQSYKNKNKLSNPLQNLFPGTSTIKKLIPLSSNSNNMLPLQKTWTSIKAAAENVLPNKIPIFPGLVISEINEYDDVKLAKRIYEEINKLFNNTDSFYYSREVDLTNSAQRLKEFKERSKDTQASYSKDKTKMEVAVTVSRDAKGNILNTSFKEDSFALPPLSYDWKSCDERFFWNFNILKDVISIMSQDPHQSSHWILPIICGYVSPPRSIESHDFITHLPTLSSSSFSRKSVFDETAIGFRSKDDRKDVKMKDVKATFCLISRRNRHRTGTRYNRRGIDEEGNAANYVETEQLIRVANHVISFVMVRGSIPLYWTQGGMKYRPQPTLEKDVNENFLAFKRHFDREIRIYKKVVIINLAEQTGREKYLSEAYLDNLLTYDNPLLIYVTFDFHEYCQGMKFENISVLTESVADIIKQMQYCWFDSKGFICYQTSVFRINCIDCLDRTNMVQMSLAKILLEIQLRKIGLLAPETPFPRSLTLIFQSSWANNGDALSVQYAGTAALKGDFTRTGQKKLTSLLKDGYNSAARYYANQFRDAYKQIAYQTLQNACPLALVEAEEIKEEGFKVSSSHQTDFNVRRLFFSRDIPAFRRLLRPYLMPEEENSVEDDYPEPDPYFDDDSSDKSISSSPIPTQQPNMIINRSSADPPFKTFYDDTCSLNKSPATRKISHPSLSHNKSSSNLITTPIYLPSGWTDVLNPGIEHDNLKMKFVPSPINPQETIVKSYK